MNWIGYKGSIVEGSRPYHVDHCLSDVQEHIAQVRREFSGKPELCALHAATIIYLRRGIEQEKNYLVFLDMWKKEEAFLLSQLDSRWLLAAVDTFADYGKPEEKACAIAINGFMNMAMFAETEYHLCGATAYKPEEITRNIDAYYHIWDGRRIFHFDDDDTFRNTIRRYRSIFADQKLLMRIFEHLLKKMFENDTILSRFAAYHKHGLW